MLFFRRYANTILALVDGVHHHVAQSPTTCGGDRHVVLVWDRAQSSQSSLKFVRLVTFVFEMESYAHGSLECAPISAIGKEWQEPHPAICFETGSLDLLLRIL